MRAIHCTCCASMRVAQQERLAAETDEQRDARLESMKRFKPSRTWANREQQNLRIAWTVESANSRVGLTPSYADQ